MVVDCGGGTVDITVHEIQDNRGRLKELYKATGGPYGSVGGFSPVIHQINAPLFLCSHISCLLACGFGMEISMHELLSPPQIAKFK